MLQEVWAAAAGCVAGMVLSKMSNNIVQLAEDVFNLSRYWAAAATFMLTWVLQWFWQHNGSKCTVQPCAVGVCTAAWYMLLSASQVLPF